MIKNVGKIWGQVFARELQCSSVNMNNINSSSNNEDNKGIKIVWQPQNQTDKEKVNFIMNNSQQLKSQNYRLSQTFQNRII